MNEKNNDSMFIGKSYNDSLKRVIDMILACLLFLFFAPISLLVAILIKLDSPGPIFADTPERVGRRNTLFIFHKFRSMKANSHYMLRTDKKFKKLYEEYKNGSYKIKDDPRVTRVGKFIRKYSLDEIPQFINVIRGEMSIVGPRAYYPDELTEQQKKFPNTKDMVKKVLSVKPGITGLWQVSGRSEVNFDKRIAMDACYVDTMSFWDDMKIILKTPFVMLSAKGAI